jgi:hypothetical protein
MAWTPPPPSDPFDDEDLLMLRWQQRRKLLLVEDDMVRTVAKNHRLGNELAGLLPGRRRLVEAQFRAIAARASDELGDFLDSQANAVEGRAFAQFATANFDAATVRVFNEEIQRADVAFAAGHQERFPVDEELASLLVHFVTSLLVADALADDGYRDARVPTNA